MNDSPRTSVAADEEKFPILQMVMLFDDPTVPTPYFYAYQCTGINKTGDNPDDANVVYATNDGTDSWFFRVPVTWLRSDDRTPIKLEAFRYESSPKSARMTVEVKDINDVQYHKDKLLRDLSEKKKLREEHINARDRMTQQLTLLNTAIETLDHEIEQIETALK